MSNYASLIQLCEGLPQCTGHISYKATPLGLFQICFSKHSYFNMEKNVNVTGTRGNHELLKSPGKCQYHKLAHTKLLDLTQFLWKGKAMGEKDRKEHDLEKTQLIPYLIAGGGGDGRGSIPSASISKYSLASIIWDSVKWQMSKQERL